MDFDRLVEKHKEDIHELSILGFNLGVAEGVKAERNRIIREIDRQICFDFTSEGYCEHAGCYILDSTMKLIREDLK
jgi:hypothetical protein